MTINLVKYITVRLETGFKTIIRKLYKPLKKSNRKQNKKQNWKNYKLVLNSKFNPKKMLYR